MQENERITYSTKAFLEKVGISESTLKKWLSEDRIPELNNVERDWRGWRTWEDKHVKAVLKYKQRKNRRQQRMLRNSPPFTSLP